MLAVGDSSAPVRDWRSLPDCSRMRAADRGRQWWSGQSAARVHAEGAREISEHSALVVLKRRSRCKSGKAGRKVASTRTCVLV